MTYSDEELDEIQHDRDRLRAYFWRMAYYHRRLANDYRLEVCANRVSIAEGRDLLRWAGVLERLSDMVLADLDAIVESTVKDERAIGTSSCFAEST